MKRIQTVHKRYKIDTKTKASKINSNLHFLYVEQWQCFQCNNMDKHIYIFNTIFLCFYFFSFLMLFGKTLNIEMLQKVFIFLVRVCCSLILQLCSTSNVVVLHNFSLCNNAATAELCSLESSLAAVLYRYKYCCQLETSANTKIHFELLLKDPQTFRKRMKTGLN